MKRLLGNLALLLGTVAVGAVLGEVVVRSLFADQNVLFPRYQTEYQYGKYTLRGMRPNAEFRHTSADGRWTFVTNGRGLRDTRDFPYEKPAGTLRPLSLGDSHTQGYEVRQGFTYTAVAERLLNERVGPAEGLNAGISGFSTAEALAYLENEGARYRPDVVVLGFYGNDFVDNLMSGLFSLDADGRLVPQKYEHIPGVKIQNVLYGIPPVRWLAENSYFYSLLFNAAWEHFKILARKSARASLPTEYAVAQGPGPTAPETELAAALILRMHAFCRSQGIRFLVVDIPQRPAPQRFSPSIPAQMAARLEAAGVELLSSESLFGPYQGGAEMHVPHGQQHISEFAHTLIGAEIARRLAGQERAPGRDGVIPARHH